MPKHSVRISALLLFLIFHFAIVSTAQTQAVNDTIIAVVNKDVITLKDLREFLSAIYVQLRSEGISEEVARQQMAEHEKTGVQRLIDQKLIVDESIKKELTIRPQAIDSRIDELKKSYPTEKDFLNAIVHEGLTVTELKKRIENELRVKYMVETEVKKKVFVNPNEVTEYYRQHTAEFQKPERVDLDSIFISYKDSDAKTAEQKSRAALQLIKNGQDFGEVARKYSAMPSIGVVSKGQMLPVIEDAVFKLKDGEVTDPVKTDTGIFIFKLKSRLPPELATLDEVRGEISNFFYRQKFQKQLVSWLDELKKKAYVEIKD